MGKVCSQLGGDSLCTPGCRPWCSGDGQNGCAWPMDSQGVLHLERQQDNANPYGHNEIIIDPSSVGHPHLPSSVLALFYTVASTDEQIQRARTAHSTFRADHPEADVPLVVYSPAAVASYLHAPPSAPGIAAQELPFALAPDQ